MVIFVSGASGFTGQHFKSFCESKSHRFVPLVGDLRDAKLIKQQIKDVQPDLVVHLGAISFAGHNKYSHYYDVNLIGTLNLLEAIAESTKIPNKILLASSAHVYGNAKISPVNENQCPDPISHYAISKLAMEKMASTFYERLPIVIARPFNYTGVGQTDRFIIPKIVSHFAKLKAQIELGNIHVEREFNDINTICDAYIKLLDFGKAGEIYNVSTQKTYSLVQILNIMQNLTGHKIKIITNPELIRKNEIQNLCGSSKKIENCIGKLLDIPIENTLQNLLAHFKYI